ncbi:MAG: catalase [Candidatus Dormibacteraeota bacterium]|nr:catalase [Candidatus Dormibacteraeota bacterium]
MASPSTEWKEVVTPDEERRFQRYADGFVAFQRTRSQRYGDGRALHRKQIMGLRAFVDVLPDLPAHAAHGLFTSPGRHNAVIRLSNASMDVHPDKVPDIRGFAIKVFDVSGPGALGGNTEEQDFVLINLPTFRVPTSEPFAGVVLARARGEGATVRYLLRRYKFAFLREVRRGVASLRWPFSGFATEPFHSAVPFACGPYAARLRIVPREPGDAAVDAREDWAADMRQRLEHAAMVFDMQLQFFVDERITPIENASVDWPQDESPYIAVATLTIPQQVTTGDIGERLEAEVERLSFDPWHALAEHRPLGEVMRARKVAYYASFKTRSEPAPVSAAG